MDPSPSSQDLIHHYSLQHVPPLLTPLYNTPYPKTPYPKPSNKLYPCTSSDTIIIACFKPPTIKPHADISPSQQPHMNAVDIPFISYSPLVSKEHQMVSPLSPRSCLVWGLLVLFPSQPCKSLAQIQCTMKIKNGCCCWF